MKPKTLSSILIVMIAAILAGNTVYAQSLSQSIHLSITVIGTLSLNIDENALLVESGKPKAEAFSRMADHGIMVSRHVRDNSNIWLFTKTE